MVKCINSHNKTINNIRCAHWEKASLAALLFPLL
jgi:hypothetical protein